jgi:hypothetical protein
MVGAEESTRGKAKTAANDAANHGSRPGAIRATGIKTTHMCQNVYGKPGALFSVNRLKVQEPGEALASVSSAERWSGIPEPTNMRRSLSAGDATETGVSLRHLLRKVRRATRFSDIITVTHQGQCNQYLRNAIRNDTEVTRDAAQTA